MRALVPAVAAAALALAAAGCGAGVPTEGAPAHSADVAKLERACARGWQFAASVQSALSAADERNIKASSVPQDVVERIGEPSGEASAAWTSAAEAARSAGYPVLSELAAHSASDYGEVEVDLSPEGGGYAVTRRSLEAAAKTNAQLAREALSHGLKACAAGAKH